MTGSSIVGVSAFEDDVAAVGGVDDDVAAVGAIAVVTAAAEHRVGAISGAAGEIDPASARSHRRGAGDPGSDVHSGDALIFSNAVAELSPAVVFVVVVDHVAAGDKVDPANRKPSR